MITNQGKGCTPEKHELNFLKFGVEADFWGADKMTTFEIDAVFDGGKHIHYAMIDVYGSKEMCDFIVEAVNEKLSKERS